eukprot:scaffold10231_cov140-Skeletonema_dohrnii-CCMP3373.AAC.1
MATTITLHQWLAFLILREKRKQEHHGDTTTNFVHQKKAAQLEYIQTAVSVALLLVQSLIVSTSSLSSQQITIDNFTVAIDDKGDAKLLLLLLNLEENPDDEDLQRIIESVTQLEFTPSTKNDSSTHANGEQQESDDDLLREVGTVLHQLFCRGIKPPLITNVSSPDEGDSDDDLDSEQPGAEKGRTKHSLRVAQKMLRKASISSLDEHVLTYGVPRNLCRLIIDLIRCEGGSEETKFRSIEEVAEELIQIISKPNLFLYDSEATGSSTGQLNFGSTLYGRRNEATSFLRAATLVSLDMMETHSKQLVLVEGLSGAGKSHFVASLIRSSSEFGWIYIHAKFDPQSQPLSVVTSAFNRFFMNILANRSEQEYVARVVSSLQRNLSSSAIVSLCDCLPSIRCLFPSVLRRVVSDEDLSSQNGVVVEDEFASGSQMSRIRLHFIFRKLISALCSVERPLALFFDDLQWADDRCMELLSALMERDHLQELDDNDGTNCLFIGSFRSNETNDNLLSHVDKFEQSTLVDVTKIELGGLAKVESNNMISEVLRIPARLTSPLNELVQRKTTGNPFHIIHFMQSLVKDSILNYSLSDKRWVWDIEAVKSTSIDKTVLELLARKLSQLPGNIVDGLKVLSCLGPKVDDTIMKYLYTSPESRNEFIACLDLAVGENILEKSGDSAYSFVHDMLKQSAYAVMSEEEKGEKHFWIGMKLIANASADTDEFNAIIFSIVDQINAANTYGVTEEALHMNFAELNLKAGKTSIDVSDFQSALSYMKAGVSLLNGWQDGEYYDMSLQLYETAALVSYLNTDIGLMQQYLEILFENAKCFEDRLHGYLVMIQSLLSNGKHVAAMKKILFILEELGESISINATPKEVYIELMSTKALLDTISPADVINGKRMADKGLRWRLRFLQLLNTPLYMLQPHAIHVTACRTVKLSVEHGFCSDSAIGLQIYGYGVLNIQNDVEECLKWNHTALSLVKSLGAKQMIPRIIMNVNILAYWKEPLQAKIESLKENHHELLMVGDLEVLPLNALHCCRQSLLCGRNLQTAQKECAALLHEMHQLRQMNALIGMISNHMSILKLIGSNYDSEELLFHLLGNSEINSLDELLQFCKSNRLVGPTQQCYFDRLMLAFWSKKYEEAAQYAEKYSECHQTRRFPDLFQTFYQGITAFRLVRLKDDKIREWADVGKNALSKYQTWVNYSDWNWENKMLLLEAELHACIGELEIAKSKFQASIDSAQKHRFVHEEGLASELFGMFYDENGNKEEAMQQYSHARSCYQKWGAFALADRLNTAS